MRKIKKDGVIIHWVNRVGDKHEVRLEEQVPMGHCLTKNVLRAFFVAHGRMIARVVVSTFSQVARIIIVYIYMYIYYLYYIYDHICTFNSLGQFNVHQCTLNSLGQFNLHQARLKASSGHQILGSWDDLKYDVGMKDFVLAGPMTEPLTETTFVEMGSRCWKKLGACVQSSMALGWFHVKQIVRIMLTSDTPWLSGFFLCGGHKSYRLINVYCKLALWGRILCLIRMLF